MLGQLQSSDPAPTGKCSRKSFGATAAERKFCRLRAGIATMFLLSGYVNRVEEQPERGVRLAAMLRPEGEQYRATLA